ncbi:hypothetical protein CMI37_35675 [Candidatus Pacearchaeota archaeon]|nr:hypothetical protein [Candidatus Pacearchaeota archaeon]
MKDNHTGDTPHGSTNNPGLVPNDVSVDRGAVRASLTRWLRSPQAVRFPATARAIDHYISAHSDCTQCILGWVEVISELHKS